jgi:hypothetical protein
VPLATHEFDRRRLAWAEWSRNGDQRLLKAFSGAWSAIPSARALEPKPERAGCYVGKPHAPPGPRHIP